MECKIEISARHIHLTEEDYNTLFADEQPKIIKQLSHGDAACEQTVSIQGRKSVLDKVRVLAPLREKSQLEISKTDAINLGIDAPLKLSGHLPGGMVKVIGPSGAFEKKIAIIAKRHIHVNSKEANQLKIQNGDTLGVKIAGERALIFGNIMTRITDTPSAVVHIDTDEANAAGLSVNDKSICEIVKDI